MKVCSLFYIIIMWCSIVSVNCDTQRLSVAKLLTLENGYVQRMCMCCWH
jgi:hypothetical protein